MAKVVITLGWKKYVVDAQQAVAVAEMLSKAEMYETKYVKDGENKSTTKREHHEHSIKRSTGRAKHQRVDSR